MNHIRYNTKASNRNSFDNFFEDFFKNDFNLDRNAKTRFTDPLVNIFEEKEAFFLELAIPGVKKEDVNIDVEKDQLMIKSTIEENGKVEEKKFTKREFSYGSFSKSFYIPETVNKEEIAATFKDGILTISLAKKEEAVDKGPLHIEVK